MIALMLVARETAANRSNRQSAAGCRIGDKAVTRREARERLVYVGSPARQAPRRGDRLLRGCKLRASVVSACRANQGAHPCALVSLQTRGQARRPRFARGPLLRRRLLRRGRRWSRVVHATRAFEDRAARLPRTVRKSKRVSSVHRPARQIGAPAFLRCREDLEARRRKSGDRRGGALPLKVFRACRASRVLSRLFIER